jgi:hypothetical protein
MRFRSITVLSAVIACAVALQPSASHAQAWVAAADPFQKFVHDVLHFTRYLIDRYDKDQQQTIADAAPSLVKSMYQVAANKRALADRIEAVMSGNDNRRDDEDLAGLTDDLDTSVRALLNNIRDLDPKWVAAHNELSKEIDKMEFEKASVWRTALRDFGNVGTLNRTDAEQFAAKLKSLADELDNYADSIASTFAKEKSRGKN